jgi:outer membrane biosynthesis protein TonB
MDIVAIGEPLDAYSAEVPAKFLPVGGKPFTGRFRHTSDTKEPGVLWSFPRMLPDSWIEKEEQKQKARSRNPRARPPADDLAEVMEKRAARQAFAKAATAFEIDNNRRHPVILDTGSLGDPMKAFDQCIRDSLRDWGIDPDLEDRIVRRPWAPDPSRWFSADDYPAELVRAGSESEVNVRLLVDASGRVTKCTSLTHYDEPKFEQIVCGKFMQRARFEPAELADGTKVPSYYINRVIFRLAP